MRAPFLRLGGLLLLLFTLVTPACRCGSVPAGGVVLIREGGVLHDNVRRVAASKDHVYYVEGEHGSGWRVRRVPKAGGATSQLAEVQKTIMALVPTDEAVYFATEGAVLRAPVGGGAAVRVFESKDVCATTVGCGLAASGGHVLVAARTGILQVPARGGPAVEIVKGAWGPHDLPTVIAVDATHLYWGHHVNKAIYRAPVGGGPAEVFVPDLEATLDPTLVLAGGFLYYMTGYKLFRVPVAGGAPTLLASAGSRNTSYPGGFQVVGETVYFTRATAYIGAGTKRASGARRSEGEGGVMKVPVAGGEPAWVARGVDQVYSLDADPDAVYLATDNGQIVKQPL